jgi:hypothetical protein
MYARFMFCAVCLMFSVQSRAQESAAVDKDEVRKLIEVSGLLNVASQRFAETGSERVLQRMKFATEEEQVRAKGVLYQESKAMFQESALSPNGLVDRIVPVYQRHLSKREIRVLLDFYELDLPSKLSSAGGPVGDELKKLAQEWAVPKKAEFEARLQKALEREGLKYETQ